MLGPYDHPEDLQRELIDIEELRDAKLSDDECVKLLDERWGAGHIRIDEDFETATKRRFVVVLYGSVAIAVSDSLTECLRQAVENVEGKEVT